MQSKVFSRGFTLIEMLVVVAIIAILAVIAVFNIGEYHAKAKISRAKADIRAICTALESYAADYNNHYPYPAFAIHNNGMDNEMNGFLGNVFELTTPVAYLSTVNLVDPFEPDWAEFSHASAMSPDWKPTYLYYNYSGWYLHTLSSDFQKFVIPFRGFCTSSTGPDRKIDSAQMLPLFLDNPNIDQAKYLRRFICFVYDPTNGTHSGGDIIQWTLKPQIYGKF